MEIFGNSQIAKLNLKDGEFELKLEKYASIAPVSAPQAPVVSPVVANEAPQAQGGEFITSPMVGTFYRCPSPGAAPYVNVGDTVKKGQTIGIIEAMKIMNEIEAECDCKILSIEVDDATPVEFSTNLVRIQKL